jgi:hypothetical protein
VVTPATLVIDASLNKRIATELKRRGRDAIALSELQLRHAKDPELLRALADHYDERQWVLVTADEDAWGREVAHRWAHMMERRSTGSVRRYSDRGGGKWAPRRR